MEKNVFPEESRGENLDTSEGCDSVTHEQVDVVLFCLLLTISFRLSSQLCIVFSFYRKK